MSMTVRRSDMTSALPTLKSIPIVSHEHLRIWLVVYIQNLGERKSFSLKILLFHAKSAKTLGKFRILNVIQCLSFGEAFKECGFLSDDAQWLQGLADAFISVLRHSRLYLPQYRTAANM